MKRIAFFVLCMLCACLLCLTASAESTTKTAASDTAEKPGQVKGMDFGKSDFNSVTFSWKKVKGADRYHIYHYRDADGKGEYIGDTRATSATVNSLESGKTYYFAVRAVRDSDGEDGELKGKMSEKLLCVTAPEGKVKPKTKSITESSVTLYWDKLPGATGYKVYYYDRQQSRYVAFDHVRGKTSMTVTGLEKNTFYSFKVRPYRWVGDALSYGEHGDAYLECTDTAGTPRTYAQAASVYNRKVNELKSTQNMTVKYNKVIDTEFLLCDEENLTKTVKNTINLFDGTLDRTYNFVGGKSGKVTPRALFEPYKKTAGVERDDIDRFYVNGYDDGYTLKMILKSEESFFDSESTDKKPKSYYDNTISLPDYKSLDTRPLKIRKADSYYSDGKLIFRIKDGKMTVLKIRCGVISSIDFTVSSLKANSAIAYQLKEDYRITYPKKAPELE